MEEKGLVERKLNIFQKLRKSFYLRNMNVKKARKYTDLPEYLKEDKEVIDAVIALDDNFVTRFSPQIQKRLVKEKPGRIKNIYNYDLVSQIINENPSIINELPEHVIYNLAYKNEFKSNREFFKYLPIDMQKKMMTESSIKFISIHRGNKIQNSLAEEYGSQYDIRNFFDKFSFEAIEQIAIEDTLENNKKRTNYNRLNMFDLKRLSLDDQIKLALLSNNYLTEISDEARIQLVGSNPLLFDKLPSKVLDKMLEEDPSLFAKLPLNVQREKVMYNDSYIPYECEKNKFNVRVFKSPEELKRFIMKPEMYFDRNSYFEITDIRNSDFIWEMGRFNPNTIKLETNNGYRSNLRNNHLIESFKERIRPYDKDGKLAQFFDSQTKYQYTEKDVNLLNTIGKLIVNDDILKNVDVSELLEFAKNPDHSKLVEIVGKTYGDKAAQIIKDRPNITPELIPNYYIFSPQIIENFGIGAVHSNLTFDMKSSAILSDLARSPEKLAKYKVFENATKDMFNDTAVDLEKKLLDFYLVDSLMNNVDFSTLTDNQKRNLQLLFEDRSRKIKPELVKVPENVKELEEYEAKRNAFYDDAIRKEPDVLKLKELISNRFFGMDYEQNHYEQLSSPSLQGMCNFYNIETFINNRKTLESQNFSEDELDLLEMLTIVKDIKDPRVLRDFSAQLAKQKDIVNPVFFKDLKEKVPMQYNKELVSALLTPEKADEMVKNGEQGISTRVDENTGVKVISLKGSDFKLYITNPCLNNSNIKLVRNVDDATEVWKTFEDGIATFSGCLIDQDEIKSTFSKGNFAFGFFNMNPNQIVGMGITDIHTSHSKKELNTSTTESLAVNYDYPEEFMRKTASRLEISDPYSDSFHKYNEVASLRTEKNLSDIKENTYGGKVLPDYIAVYGEATPQFIEAAKRMGIENVIELHEECYRGRSYMRGYQKPEENTPRKESETMRKMKKIANGGNEDGR